jgi:ankyrin repeat protein
MSFLPDMVRTFLVLILACVVAPDARAESPLWEAITYSDVGKAKTLIALGANVNYKNSYGYSVLHHAVYSGNAELVELLIAKGAEVNAKAQFDRTPLHSADRKATAEILLAQGQVDAQTNPRDLLHLAAGGAMWPRLRAMLRQKRCFPMARCQQESIERRNIFA